jgi:hypothetical protein
MIFTGGVAIQSATLQAGRERALLPHQGRRSRRARAPAALLRSATVRLQRLRPLARLIAHRHPGSGKAHKYHDKRAEPPIAAENPTLDPHHPPNQIQPGAIELSILPSA